MLFLFLLLPSFVTSQTPLTSYDDTDGALKKGIIFHEDKKILLAEKSTSNFSCLFQLLTCPSKLNLKLANTLASMWQMPSYFCYLNYTNTSIEGFNVNWLLTEVQKEIHAAQIDIKKLHAETVSFSTPPSPKAPGTAQDALCRLES